MKGLSIKNVTSGYDDHIILKDFSLDVGSNEILVLMGISGSGKTTLLLTILGIIKARTGQIFLNDQEINNLEIENRGIGYLPQDYGLFPHMSVSENIGYGLKMRGADKSKIDLSVKELLLLVDLNGLEDRKINDLSGGQKQRVGLARALATKPNLLLLDEPLSNIDQVTKLEVAKGLKDLFRKLEIPIILVTHNHEDAIFLSEKIAILIDGKIEQLGHISDVLKAPKSALIKKLLMPFTEMA